MKKVFILLTCTLLLVGCAREEKLNTPTTTTTTTTRSTTTHPGFKTTTKPISTTTTPIITNTTSKPIQYSNQIVCKHRADYSQAGYVIDAEYKINYTGDLVDYVESTEIVTSSSNQVLDYFVQTLNTSYGEQNKTYGGYDFKVTKSGNKVTSKVVINYHKMDMARFVGDNPSLSIFVKDNLLTVQGIKSIYAASGITCPNN